MHHVASKDTACCMVGGGRWEPDLTGGGVIYKKSQKSRHFVTLQLNSLYTNLLQCDLECDEV